LFVLLESNIDYLTISAFRRSPLEILFELCVAIYLQETHQEIR